MAPPPVFHAPERPADIPSVDHGAPAERLPRGAERRVDLVDRQPFQPRNVGGRHERAGHFALSVTR